ncbi:MAG TPA: transporter substrate-binding domain-containing protein [Candidatus Scatomorpha pullistercoris]|uniref:Transporter substrate-binding domain-containing protein n=1 Tax=Candidatus Scatomorpha pullistercoris TaxID=2840929 RepID=A0A9D1K811_9FIRM|nr:transporter substrate-binding domain-containing protein [Candidatus Scatomorpha pullistercoris]
MKKILALMLALCMVFALAACGEPAASDPTDAPASDAPSDVTEPADEGGDDAVDSDLAYVQDKGTLVVGITNFAPMDYQDESGEWIGFDADLAKAFAESLGVEVVFQEIEWGNKVFELDGKTIDVVWNGMTLTDEVLSSMECSNAYCNNAQVVILPAAEAENYPDAASMADLQFAVESGSAGMDMAIENGFNYTEVIDQATAVLEVSSGTCQAAIIDSLMAAAMVGEGTSYADLTYTISLNSEEYGVGFRKGSDLCAALNDFFAAAWADGTMQELAETYGVTAALIPQE